MFFGASAQHAPMTYDDLCRESWKIADLMTDAAASSVEKDCHSSPNCRMLTQQVNHSFCGLCRKRAKG
jgi:hypothetical protein